MERLTKSSVVIMVGWVALGFMVAVIVTFWYPPFIRAIAARMAATITNAFPPHWTLSTIILLNLSLVATLFLAIFLHEMGHALVGVAVGFRINSLRVGPVEFYRPFRISLYRGKGTGAGGWVSLLPVKLDKLILRTVLMLLAGPAANLLSVWIVSVLPYTKGPASLWFVYWSLLLGIVNLLPFRSRAVVSDGGRIVMLLQNRARGERWLAMLKLLAELRSGVPHEKLTPGFLDKAVAIQDNSPDTVVAHALAYGAAFWQRKDDEAAQALEVCLKYSSFAAPATRHALMSDAAVFQARRLRHVDLAKQWLEDIPEKTEYAWMRPRAEAAILEAQDDITGALARLDEVEKMILAVPNQALREMSLRGLRRWKAELQPQPQAAAGAEVTV